MDAYNRLGRLGHNVIEQERGSPRVSEVCMRVMSLLCVAVLLSACDGSTAPIPIPPSSPSPPGPQPQPPSLGATVSRAIDVGDKATGTLNPWDTWVIDLTAPKSGTAVVRLTWDLSLTWMDLKWEDRLFEGPRLPGGDGLILVRTAVDEGRTYRLTILDAYPWENYRSTFVLDTSLEE